MYEISVTLDINTHYVHICYNDKVIQSVTIPNLKPIFFLF